MFRELAKNIGQIEGRSSVQEGTNFVRFDLKCQTQEAANQGGNVVYRKPDADCNQTLTETAQTFEDRGGSTKHVLGLKLRTMVLLCMSKKQSKGLTGTVSLIWIVIDCTRVGKQRNRFISILLLEVETQ